jgi:hypothetical protein
MGCGRWGFSDHAPETSDASLDATTLPRQLQITITGRGAAFGTFGVCTSQCTYAVAGDVVVTAAPADTWSLVTTSSCVGTTCTVPADVDHLDLAFAQAPITANLAFVSSTNVSLTSGVAALDTHCANLATAQGLSGTFIAFASTTTVNARDRLAGSRGWVRVDSVPVLDQVADIGSATLPHSITLDETGGLYALGLGLLVATGSNEDGTVDTGNNCGNWSTTTMQMSGGVALAASNWMLGGWVSQCSTTNRIYCMQTGRNVAVTVTPSVFPIGRRLFATTGYLPLGTNAVAAGDQLCQSEAGAAGLTGTYLALLATTTQSAADHLGSLAGPWRRTDGALVTLGDLDAPIYDVAITVGASGTSNPAMLAFGAPDLHALGQATANCDDWTNSTGTIRLVSPRLVAPFDIWGAGGFGGSCNSASVLCAELP